mgnify:CR=1 FL=1
MVDCKRSLFFGKYCVTMRDETEWVELVDNGFNRLVGSNQAMIEDTYALLVDAPKTGFENRLMEMEMQEIKSWKVYNFYNCFFSFFI